MGSTTCSGTGLLGFSTGFVSGSLLVPVLEELTVELSFFVVPEVFVWLLEVCFLPSEETEDLGSAFAEDLAFAFTELDSFEAASVFCSVSESVAFPTSSNFSVCAFF